MTTPDKVDDKVVEASKTDCCRVSESDLFLLLLDEIVSPSHARIAAHVLFWLQYSRHKLRGRQGIYKEDIELAKKLGSHPKTCGRLFRDLATTGTSRSKKLKLTQPLLEIAYGPKPGQRGGRVRWIFATPSSDKWIEDAANARRERDAAKVGKKTKSLIGTKATTQSPQIAPTLSNKNVKEGPEDSVSTLTPAPKEKKCDSISEKEQAEVDRLVNAWNATCKKYDRSKLVWRSSEVTRYAKDLHDIMAVCEIVNLSDEALASRLRLLCIELEEVSYRLSDAFKKYNKNGLQLRSFVMYGQPLWVEVEQTIAKKKKLAEKKNDALNYLKAIGP